MYYRREVPWYALAYCEEPYNFVLRIPRMLALKTLYGLMKKLHPMAAHISRLSDISFVKALMF
jgi:hypothetical protein